MTTATTSAAPVKFNYSPGTIQAPAPGKYWSQVPVSEVPIDAWVKQFNENGFLFVANVLAPDVVARLRADLDRGYRENLGDGGPDKGQLRVLRRLFEFSNANRDLFQIEPIVTFAEKLVAADCHVIHNNSFRTAKDQGIAGWHADDNPHFMVKEGTAPPTNVHLPVLWFTANYYLTDVESVEQGATQLIRGSHLLGRWCPADPLSDPELAKLNFDCIGPAGSVIMFNNQVWHHGAINKSSRVREITQVTYARRIIGHMYFPFMNYQMPEHVYRDVNPRLKRLLGFKPSGAYG